MIQQTQAVEKIKHTSPGKINLHLAVGEKRSDGFHGLNSVMVALDFADSLFFSFLTGNEKFTALTTREEGPFSELIQKGQQFPPIPVENNLVYRAAELFRLKTGFSANLAIQLIKRN